MARRPHTGLLGNAFAIRLSKADRAYLDLVAEQEETSVAGAVSCLIEDHRREQSLSDEERSLIRSLIRRIRRGWRPA